MGRNRNRHRRPLLSCLPIVVSVVAGFVFGDDPTIKQFGFARSLPLSDTEGTDAHGTERAR